MSVELTPGTLIAEMSRDDFQRGRWGTFLGLNPHGRATVCCAGFFEHGTFHRWRDGGPHTYFAQLFDLRELTAEERDQVTGT